MKFENNIEENGDPRERRVFSATATEIETARIGLLLEEVDIKIDPLDGKTEPPKLNRDDAEQVILGNLILLQQFRGLPGKAEISAYDTYKSILKTVMEGIQAIRESVGPSRQ